MELLPARPPLKKPNPPRKLVRRFCCRPRYRSFHLRNQQRFTLRQTANLLLENGNLGLQILIASVFSRSVLATQKTRCAKLSAFSLPAAISFRVSLFGIGMSVTTDGRAFVQQ